VIGENSFILGSDYPHGDPSRQEDMVAEFRERRDLSPQMVEKMLGTIREDFTDSSDKR
jgi:hypothetical protein